MPDEPGRWIDHPLLEELPEPPPGWIATPGAILLAVETPRGTTPYRWDCAIALAWARSPATGIVAVLLAWESVWSPRDEARPRRLAPRWGWYRFNPPQCRAMKAVRTPNPWGQEWWGRPQGAPISVAMREAAASLPPELRATALRQATPEEIADLPHV